MSDNLPTEGGSANIPLIPTEIPSQELQYFKEKVKRWLMIDKQVADLEGQIKEIKKVKKELMPEITKFMVQYNISDLNTEDGKLKCSERKTKQTINKAYEELSRIYHPDNNPNYKEESEEIFKKLSYAYQILIDDKKREEYND